MVPGDGDGKSRPLCWSRFLYCSPCYYSTTKGARFRNKELLRATRSERASYRRGTRCRGGDLPLGIPPPVVGVTFRLLRRGRL